jgi:hypothetical protein
LSKAAADESDAYRGDGKHSDCFSHPPSFPEVACSFGDKSSKVNVALVGNSHAGQWVPAMERIAKSRHWHLTTYVASQCAFAAVRQHFAGAAESGCRHWVHNTLRAMIARHFDLVVMTNRISVTAEGGATSPAANLKIYQQGYATVLRRLAAAKVPVVVVHDTPAPGGLVPACLQKHRADYSKCDGKRSVWLTADPAVDAAREVGGPDTTSVDLSDRICGPTTCAAVIGGVPVYKDGSHLTATYNRTLAPYLEPALVRAITHNS